MSNPPPSPPSENHFLRVKKFQKCLNYEEQLPLVGGIANLDLQVGVLFDCSPFNPVRAFAQFFLLLCLEPQALPTPQDTVGIAQTPHCPLPL